MRKYIGLSLSNCLRDIAQGRINLDEVSAIVSSTAFISVQECLDEYYYKYWYSLDKILIAKTLNEVWPFVCQPRLQVGAANHRGHPAVYHWINVQQGAPVRLNESKDY